MDDFAGLFARYGLAVMPFLFFLLLDFAGALLRAGAAVALGFVFGEEVAETARVRPDSNSSA